ncbi:MAG: TIGR03118 family protein [Gaiellaceae bacterium]
MTRLSVRGALLAIVVVAGLVAAAPTQAGPPGNHFTVTPLVSDIPGVAPTTDANLQNSWGLARSGTSPWWVADNGTAKTTVYNAAGALQSINGDPFKGVPGAPTGAVFSGISGQFQVGTTQTPATLGTSNFIFDSEDGTISAWRSASAAALVTVPAANGAEFKGLAISNDASLGPRLYATDFANAKVDVFDGSWTPVNTPGAFVDPNLPNGFAPFGIQTIASQTPGSPSHVFVTYGIQGPNGDEIDRNGAGIVDEYDLDGTFVQRVATRGFLNAPWGLAMAPAGWPAVGGDLLIGNFGNGKIHAFTQQPDGSFKKDGALRDENGKKIEIDGLWALEFAGGGANGDPNNLYFTAGPNDEADGLFGTIKPAS